MALTPLSESLGRIQQAAEEARWEEQKKRGAYRQVWRIRRHATPKGKETWGQWFGRMFGQPIEEYHEQLRKQAKEDEDRSD